jgi:hypothetical protein
VPRRHPVAQIPPTRDEGPEQPGGRGSDAARTGAGHVGERGGGAEPGHGGALEQRGVAGRSAPAAVALRAVRRDGQQEAPAAALRHLAVRDLRLQLPRSASPLPPARDRAEEQVQEDISFCPHTHSAPVHTHATASINGN